MDNRERKFRAWVWVNLSNCAQIEPLAHWSQYGLINRYVHDTELSTWYSSLAEFSSMSSIFSSMRIFDVDLLYDYFNRPDAFVLKFIIAPISEST